MKYCDLHSDRITLQSPCFPFLLHSVHPCFPFYYIPFVTFHSFPFHSFPFQSANHYINMHDRVAQLIPETEIEPFWLSLIVCQYMQHATTACNILYQENCLVTINKFSLYAWIQSHCTFIKFERSEIFHLKA